MDHNSFSNFTWTNSYQDADITATGTLNTWVQLSLINTSLTFNKDDVFFMYRDEIFFGNNNTGIFLVNCSFNSDGATNDDLGLKISYVSQSVEYDSSICKWNSKGGNTWSINHSAILHVDKKASLTDGMVRFYTINYTDTINFNISNLNINIIRLL
jgi:hypothetical protein